jgi:tetratricopeptide (TPR) repeat protein
VTRVDDDVESLLARGAHSKAIEVALKRSIAKPKDVLTLDLLARAYVANSDRTKALYTYDRLIKLLPKHPKPLADKAHFLQKLGDDTQANILLRKALELTPTNGSLLRMLSVTDRLTPSDPYVIAQKNSWDAGKMSPRDKVHAGFGLFRALGATGLPYLSEANALQRKANPWSIDNRKAEIRAFQNIFNAEPRPEIKPDLSIAPLFITGMPRSGTTLIEQILSSHSRVTALGETGFPLRAAYTALSKNNSLMPLDKVPSARLEHMTAQLTKALRGSDPDRFYLTDKSIPTYLVAGLLKAIYPCGRVIFVHRDPRDIGWSIWRNHFSDGSHGYSNCQRDIARQIKLFKDMVEYWMAKDPTGFINVSYEDIVRDPRAQISALLNKCGLTEEEACFHPEQNTRTVSTLSIDQVRHPINAKSIGGWKKYENHLEPLIEELNLLQLP